MVTFASSVALAVCFGGWEALTAAGVAPVGMGVVVLQLYCGSPLLLGALEAGGMSLRAIEEWSEGPGAWGKG